MHCPKTPERGEATTCYSVTQYPTPSFRQPAHENIHIVPWIQCYQCNHRLMCNSISVLKTPLPTSPNTINHKQTQKYYATRYYWYKFVPVPSPLGPVLASHEPSPTIHDPSNPSKPYTSPQYRERNHRYICQRQSNSDGRNTRAVCLKANMGF